MSSYIAFDLDALNVAPDVARAAGISEDRAITGLARMWAWCFRSAVEIVNRHHVTGFFSVDCADVLVSFGFLEPNDEGSWRVKGADRYLRVSEGRSRGGKMASGNLKKGTQKPPKTPRLMAAESPAPPGTAPGSSPAASRLLPGLSPNTEHRTPNTFKNTVPEKPAPRESDLLESDFLEATGKRYVWNGAKDGVALAKLRKTETLDEVRARWRRALHEPDGAWLGCRTVAQLSAKWNDLATTIATRAIGGRVDIGQRDETGHKADEGPLRAVEMPL